MEYLVLLTFALGLPPSVYWVSSPTHANETLMIAGAGLDGAKAEVCCGILDEVVCAPTTATSWQQSVQLVLPLPLAAPTRVRITGKAGGSVVVVVK